MALSNTPPLLSLSCASKLRPTCATPGDVFSATSYLTSVGEISHIRSRSESTSSYGSGDPTTSDRALHDILLLAQILVNQHSTTLPDDLPVHSSSTRRRHSSASNLCSALRVHPRCTLLGIRCSGEAYIRELRANISMVALVDDKCARRDRFRGDIIGVEEIDKFGFLLRRSCRVSDIVCSSAGGGLLKWVIVNVQ